jgi:uncharacterized membrane protein YsdA (DUF1294 family)
MMLMLLGAGINIGAFIAFGWDKRQSERRLWRVSERSLLMLALMGGALGALLGQQFFRHKTRKQPFRALLWCAALINILAAVVMWRLQSLGG